MFEAHILVHVPDGVDVDQRPDARDDQHHRGRERVDAEGPVDGRSPMWIHSAILQHITSPWLAESVYASSTETTNAAPEAALAIQPMAFRRNARQR